MPRFAPCISFVNASILTAKFTTWNSSSHDSCSLKASNCLASSQYPGEAKAELRAACKYTCDPPHTPITCRGWKQSVEQHTKEQKLTLTAPVKRSLLKAPPFMKQQCRQRQTSVFQMFNEDVAPAWNYADVWRRLSHKLSNKLHLHLHRCFHLDTSLIKTLLNNLVSKITQLWNRQYHSIWQQPFSYSIPFLSAPFTLAPSGRH